MLILSGGFAAVLDAQAQTPQAWGIAQRSFQMFMTSLRVERDAGASRPTATAASRKLAGSYVGVKPKFVSAIGPGIGAGSGGFVDARHIYLFSDDGRVYRAYDQIGDESDFDFDGAAVSDPVNSGHYAIAGKQLTLQMGERLDEEIVVAMPNRGRLIIEGVDIIASKRVRPLTPPRRRETVLSQRETYNARAVRHNLPFVEVSDEQVLCGIPGARIIDRTYDGECHSGANEVRHG